MCQTTAAGWHLYLLECRNGALYSGIATDVERRFNEHVTGKGAKYTRANRPVKIVASRPYPDRSSASKAEYALKRLPKAAKPDFFK